MLKLHELQLSYVNDLASRDRQIARLPLGIGVTEIIEEVARVKGKQLVVICPRLIILSRQWGEGVRQYTPQHIVRGTVEIARDDLVYIDVGVEGRQSVQSLLRYLSMGVDFIWRTL